MAAALTADQAKKLAAKLVQRLQALADFRQKQAGDNVKTRKGKHVAELDPLIAALPVKQQALGVHVSLEHDRTRETIQKTVDAATAAQHRHSERDAAPDQEPADRLGAAPRP